MFKNFFLFFLIITITACKSETILFNENDVTAILLIIMEDSGDNEIKYFFSDGIKKIIELLNKRNKGFAKDVNSEIDEYTKYYLRIETKNDYYILKFKNQSDFILNVDGENIPYNINDFLFTLLDMDSYNSFDISEIVSVRAFNETLTINTEIKISQIASLMENLEKTKDEKVLKTSFNLIPILIIRIQQNVGGIQLFCNNDAVWINGKEAVYVFKSENIKKSILEIMKAIQNR